MFLTDSDWEAEAVLTHGKQHQSVRIIGSHRTTLGECQTHARCPFICRVFFVWSRPILCYFLRCRDIALISDWTSISAKF